MYYIESKLSKQVYQVAEYPDLKYFNLITEFEYYNRCSVGRL